MENPLVTWFIIGFLLGFMFGTYMGNKKFRAYVNKMIRGREKSQDDDNIDEEDGDYNRKYDRRNRNYRDGRNR